jgi:hypothetical protein
MNGSYLPTQLLRILNQPRASDKLLLGCAPSLPAEAPITPISFDRSPCSVTRRGLAALRHRQERIHRSVLRKLGWIQSCRLRRYRAIAPLRYRWPSREKMLACEFYRKVARERGDAVLSH